MTTETCQRRPGVGEFIALTALLVSLVALSIDAMLPALPEIGADLANPNANDNQLVISTLFLGLAFGQLIYGPLSDSYGRKPVIFLGLAIFMLGSLMSMFASSFSLMLVGRLIQGVGVAGPRIVTVALVRDQYEGRAMARIMSFVMVVFILVPVLAPALGQLILMVADWRAIFAVFLAIAVVAIVWTALRQPETLPKANRVALRPGIVMAAMVRILTTRTALGYTLAAGLIFGAFVGYLNSAQQIFQQNYALGAWFPLYFAVLALAIGAAALVNAHLVMRLGMATLSKRAALWIGLLSLGFLPFAWAVGGLPPLWAMTSYLLALFFCIGILFGNLNAMAMEPLGDIAGIGATVVGFLSTLIAVALGTAIGRAYDGTVLPLVAGFAILGVATLVTLCWAGAQRLH